jgi:hypothetical protein
VSTPSSIVYEQFARQLKSLGRARSSGRPRPQPRPRDRIWRYLVGLKMPQALKTSQTMLPRIEQGEVTALEAIEALLGEECTPARAGASK